jgi:tRNA (guanine-N7-)-methyltransferase
VIKKGGELRVATDDPTLQEWTDEQLKASLPFSAAPGLMKARPEGWPATRYEEKALLAGRTPLYWLYKRV